MQETQVQSLGWKDSLEKEMATHASILAWQIPWAEEAGRLHSMGPQRVRHDQATEHTFSDNLHSLYLCMYWQCQAACGILVPQPGMEPRPMAVKAGSPNHWTAREFPLKTVALVYINWSMIKYCLRKTGYKRICTESYFFVYTSLYA